MQRLVSHFQNESVPTVAHDFLIFTHAAQNININIQIIVEHSVAMEKNRPVHFLRMLTVGCW